ncbi:flagella synthesis protein FlgN [Oxalobacteraceae bacterium GrIS 1.11]
MKHLSHLTRQDMLTMLLRGVADDVPAYAALLLMLEEQFDTALRHQSALLTEVAERIGAAVEAMEARRRQRVSLVCALIGPAGTMAQVMALLKGPSRLALESHWLELERMVLECKRRNSRNSELLSNQYSIMQRVLHGEEQIYAPA